MADQSLSTTKAKIGLAYGDAALIGMQLLRCLEHELALRDERIAALEQQLNQRKEKS